MSKFKVGDKVRVREDLDLDTTYCMECSGSGEKVTHDMIDFSGKIVTISGIDPLVGFYEVFEDVHYRNWADGMFDDMIYGFDEEIKNKDSTNKTQQSIKPRNEFMRGRAKELALVIYENLDAGDKVNQEWLDELWDLNQYIAESEE